MVKPCLDPDPKARPTAKDVLKFIDMTIKRILAQIAKALPEPDIVVLSDQLDRLKAQRNVP
jgi:hypothetical protein